MDFNLFDINSIEGEKIDLLIQGFLLLVLIFYTIFSLLVSKQVRILNENIQTTDAPALNKAARTQLLASVGLLVLIILLIAI